jgi:hypothetical protein
VNEIIAVTKVLKIHTVAIALFKGELLFSSTMLPMDSIEATRECDPNGLAGGVGLKKGSGACR